MKGEGRCGRLGVVAAMITPPGAGVKDKKRAILEATLAVLRERGLSGLKMEEVARRAEVGKGTIYLYFRDKRDLLKALVEERTWAFYREVEEVVRRKAPFFVRPEEVPRRRLAWVQEWRGLWAAVAREAMDDPTPGSRASTSTTSASWRSFCGRASRRGPCARASPPGPRPRSSRRWGAPLPWRWKPIWSILWRCSGKE